MWAMRRALPRLVFAGALGPSREAPLRLRWLHDVLLQGLAQQKSSRKDCLGMTQSENDKLFEALRGPLEYCSDPLAQRIMDECAGEDLRAIAPAVEEIERNAEARGRFALWLEVCARNLHRAAR